MTERSGLGADRGESDGAGIGAASRSVVVSAPDWRPIRSLYRGRSMGQVDLKGKGALELIKCLALD